MSMPNHYQINVIKNGRLLFATSERSCFTRDNMEEVYKEIASRFTVPEYEIIVTHNKCHHNNVPLTELPKVA